MNRKLMIAGFWLLIIGPNLLFPFMQSSADSGDMEKRELAPLPTLSSESYQEFPKDMESYINDHAAFRSSFLSANAALNLKLFGHAESQDVLKGKDGWYFFMGGEALGDCLGTNRFSPDILSYIGSSIQTAADYFRSQGIEFIVMFPPNKEAVYGEYLPAGYQQVSEITKSEELIAYLRANSDVTILDPREYFRENTDYLWYYKTDTHWNEAAGFAASQMIIEAAGKTPTPITDVEVTYTPCKPGDLTNLFHLPEDLSEDVSASISGYLENTSPQMTDVNGNGSVVHSETVNAPDDRHLAFYRDSFGPAVAGTLSKYFKYTDFYHWQAFDASMLSERKPDILVYEIVDREQGRIPEDMRRLAPGAFQ